MAGQVCKVFLLRRLTEAGYAFSVEERAAKFAQAAAVRAESGGSLLFNALAGWSSYDIYGFGAELFPGLESLKQHTAALEKLDWFRYVESETFIGTPIILNEPAYPNPIFVLQLVKGIREAGYALPEGELENRFKQVAASADALGVRRILRMTCRWSREDYGMVQVHEWPSLEAQTKHTAFEEQMDWPRYFNQRHVLGIKAE